MNKKYLTLIVWIAAAVASVYGQERSKPVKQPREVVEAYRVCAEFQRLMSENLDFDRAFEATFTKDRERRRQIAIAESELGNIDLSQVDDATLVGLYKDQMQGLFLMLPFFGATKEEAALIFPPPIKTILDRVPPENPQNLPAYAAQLKRDVAELRARLDEISATYPFVAERVQTFKEAFLKKHEPPAHVVRPLTAYSKGRVLRVDEKYYQIEEYAVIREGDEMRIIGIRFFSRMF